MLPRSTPKKTGKATLTAVLLALVTLCWIGLGAARSAGRRDRNRRVSRRTRPPVKTALTGLTPRKTRRVTLTAVLVAVLTLGWIALGAASYGRGHQGHRGHRTAVRRHHAAVERRHARHRALVRRRHALARRHHRQALAHGHHLGSPKHHGHGRGPSGLGPPGQLKKLGRNGHIPPGQLKKLGNHGHAQPGQRPHSHSVSFPGGGGHGRGGIGTAPAPAVGAQRNGSRAGGGFTSRGRGVTSGGGAVTRVAPGPGGAGLVGVGVGAPVAPTGHTGGAARVTTPLASGTTQIGARGRTRTTAPSLHHPLHPSKAVPAASFPTVIERFIQFIPWWIWLAFGAAFLGATAAGAAAWRYGRRARAQAAQVALVEADAMTDPLTGVLNRRGFGAAAQRELERAQRYGHPLALAFVDVRGLKTVNDTQGHQAGDMLLRRVAGVLQQSSRSHDLVGRIGGDELAVLLTEQGAAGMGAVIRRVRAQLPATRAALGFDHDWDLTIGMAVFPKDGHSLEALLDAADRRLYMQRGITLR